MIRQININKLNVLIACTDRKRRMHIARSIMETQNCNVVADCDNGMEAMSILKNSRPEIAIIDVSLDRLDGMSLLDFIHEEAIETKVVLIPEFADRNLLRSALESGVKGFSYLKSFAQVAECLDAILVGEFYVDTELYHAHYFSRRG